MLTFSELAAAVEATHTRGGGVGWDVNGYVTLRQDVNVHVNLRQQLMMMMMIMTLMKLVNSATKFRHGMDKFYQPNSGLRGSRSGDEATYTYIIVDTICIYLYTQILASGTGTCFPS